MKIRNKPLFWTGLSFQIIQIAIVGIYGLTLLSWAWFTHKIFILIILASAWLLFNGLSIVMMYFGLKRDTSDIEKEKIDELQSEIKKQERTIKRLKK